MRLDADLSARALATLAGWHFTKVSKLEHGTRPPSAADIRAWCRCCGAEDQVSDLIATARSIDAMYAEWRRQMRSGLKHLQEKALPLYERTQHFRAYENTVIPGLLNTAGYAAAILRTWAELMDLPADIDAAVAARMERQKVLYSGARNFQFVIEEQTLRTQVGDAETMAGPEAPFDPASLPSVESITADTDILAFLRAGVPAELTRAALRRAWTSDPAIRDFIGIAENQWDFNDPNAIPGFGPMVPTESGVDILAQISSRLESQPRAPEDLAAAEPTIASNANADASDRPLVINNPPLVSPAAAPDEMPARAEGAIAPTVGETGKTRRHGSALPH